MSHFPDSGKIQDGYFKQTIFLQSGASRPEVKAGPQYGVDVAVVSLPNGMDMALTSDPLSLIPTLGLRESAWLSVHLMANDMATTGIAPMYAQFVLNLPTTITALQFEEYWHWIHTYCNDIKVSITGGHTGKAEGQQSTMAGGGTMIAIAHAGTFLLSKNAQPGNTIIVTKQSALIATSILALSFPQTVKDKCGTATWQAACRLFEETSSLQAGITAPGNAEAIDQAVIPAHAIVLPTGPRKEVTAMHDVTEGGILGAIIELATASGCGVRIESNLLPIGEVQQQIGQLFNIDPRWCVGAGSMILTTPAGKEEQVIQRLQQKGIPATRVGVITPAAEGITICENGQQQQLKHPGTDPYWAAFYHALKNGWK